MKEKANREANLGGKEGVERVSIGVQILWYQNPAKKQTRFLDPSIYNLIPHPHMNAKMFLFDFS